MELTLIVEKILDTLGQGGEDRVIKEQIQTSQQQSADHNTDKDLQSGINEAFTALTR